MYPTRTTNSSGRSRLHDELQPDEHGEPDRPRPASEPLGVVGGGPALDVGSRQDPGRHVVDRRERVEEVPGRADDRADDGQADPAVVPQEEGRDLPVARPAGDPLADDPQPADQPDGAQPEPQPGRRQRPRRGEVRRRRPDVADDDERERQCHGRRGADDVDRERQPARVGRVQGMGRDRRGQDQGEADRRREAARQACRKPRDHVGVVGGVGASGSWSVASGWSGGCVD